MPQALSHGTLECNEKEASNRFYTEVLGLEIVGGGQSSTYIAHPDAPWYIVVLPRPERNYLAPVNRFTLKLASPDEVRDAHGSFADAGAELGVTELWTFAPMELRRRSSSQTWTATGGSLPQARRCPGLEHGEPYGPAKNQCKHELEGEKHGCRQQSGRPHGGVGPLL